MPRSRDHLTATRGMLNAGHGGRKDKEFSEEYCQLRGVLPIARQQSFPRPHDREGAASRREPVTPSVKRRQPDKQMWSLRVHTLPVNVKCFENNF